MTLANGTYQQRILVLAWSLLPTNTIYATGVYTNTGVQNLKVLFLQHYLKHDVTADVTTLGKHILLSKNANNTWGLCIAVCSLYM